MLREEFGDVRCLPVYCDGELAVRQEVVVCCQLSVAEARTTEDLVQVRLILTREDAPPVTCFGTPHGDGMATDTVAVRGGTGTPIIGLLAKV